MPFDPLSSLPFLTSDIPGIGGRIKHVPEDFDVEEIPAYEPSGEGGYLYLWIEKRAMGAEYFVRQLARRLELSPQDVGTAGLKDRQAVTRQMVSVPDVAEGRLGQLDGEGIRLLGTSRHTNKLKPGHLRGNRFRILIRDSQLASAELVAPIVDKVRQHGLPNFYGPQRFGREGETFKLGLSLMQGRASNEQAARRPGRISPFLRKLALSAVQSALFNSYLSLRLEHCQLRQVLEGDVMAKLPFGGMFRAENLSIEQARFEAQETMHTGPIFGRKMFPAAAFAAEREREVLHLANLSSDSFAGFGKLLLGTRRHNLVYIHDLQAVTEPDGLRLSFTLPAGSYATVLLREFTKSSELDTDEPTP